MIGGVITSYSIHYTKLYDAALGERVELGQHAAHVECDARSEDVHHRRVEDARRQQVQGEASERVHDRVARVATALVTHHEGVGGGLGHDHDHDEFETFVVERGVV